MNLKPGEILQDLIPGGGMVCSTHRETEATSEITKKGQHVRYCCPKCERGEPRESDAIHRELKIPNPPPGEPEYMTREQALLVQPGMVLELRRGWSQGRQRCERHVEILEVKEGPRASQTQVHFSIKALNGEILELDAGWFIPTIDLIPL